MAQYVISNPVTESGVDVFAPNVVTSSATQIVVMNVDGTITTIDGTGLTLSGSFATGGTMTALTRTTSGGVLLERFDQLNANNNSLVIFWNAATAADRLAYLTSQSDTGTGSSGDDDISLGAGDDTLIGGDGNDTLDGGTGFDIYRPGAGNDTLIHAALLGDNDGARADYSDATGAITVTLGTGGSTTGTVVGDASVGTDTLMRIEEVRGTSFDDTFTAGATYLGVDGNFQLFTGGAGNDTVTGNGNTRVNYSTAAAGVEVDLESGFGRSIDFPADAADVGIDTFFGGINSISGSAFDDELYGTNGTQFERFRALAGNDLIDGRGGSNDEADYRTSSAGIVAVMGGSGIGTGTVEDGFGTTDTLVNIERIRGSGFADIIIGDDGNNRFEGRAGNDQIEGGGGADLIFGGSGEDTIIGGDGTDDLRGENDNDTIRGGDGDDSLNGGGGSDTLFGDGGFDFFLGGSGVDFFNGTLAEWEVENGYSDRDTVSFQDQAGGVIVNLTDAEIMVAGVTVAAGTARLADGTAETLVDIERIRGTNQADYLKTSDTANQREQLLAGIGGADTLVGSATGVDVVDYSRDANFGGGLGVTVNLATGIATDGFGATDTLVDIDRVRGTNFNDTFIGNDGSNLFRLLGGNDTVDGGLGIDRIDLYTGDIFNVVGATVNLATGTVSSALSNVSATLTSIEDVSGSTGDDTFTGDAGDNGLFGFTGDDILDGGDGDDLINGEAGADTLIGGLGDDTVSFAYLPDEDDYNIRQFPTEFTTLWAGVTVNLATGTAIGPDGETDTLSGFENVVGTFFDDTITGDALNNGFAGLGGNDTIDGGAGIDEVFYGRWDGFGRVSVIPGVNGSDPDGVIVNLSAAAVTATITSGSFTVAAGEANDGEGGTDTLIGIENVIGSKGDDTIVGNSGANVIDGGAGADRIDGGGGVDTVDYDRDATAGVVVSLLAGTGTGGDAEGDVLLNIENINGTFLADQLTGNGVANRLMGGFGNDLLQGGAGSDVLDGGADVDTASYAASAIAVSVSLSTGTGSAGDATGDRLIDIERVIGSAFNDVLLGGAAADTLEGGLGNDTLRSLAGNDSLFGGDGNDAFNGGAGADRIDGGAGIDTASYSDSALAVTVNLTTLSATGGDATGDTLIAIENLTGSAFNDVLSGDANANTLNGNAGNDILRSLAGNDVLSGGDGNDAFNGGAGADRIDGGAGSDTASYSDSAQGVTVNLTTGTGLGGDAQGDTLIAIENLTGSAFADTLIGSTGNNILNAGAGNDRITGGIGADTLTGGAGLDVFDFRSSGEGGDRISDFNVADDQLEFVASGFGGGLTPGTDVGATGRFAANTTGTATAALGQFVYDTDGGQLYWDVDGTGAANRVLVTTLDGTPVLTAADIIIV